MEASTRQPGNRDKLLAGALVCLRDRGYAHTTARDLVAASGANLASIGYHFGSKEALLEEALIAGFEEWVDAVERAAFAPEGGTSAERIERALPEMLDRFEELRPFLVSFVEALPQALRSPELRDRMAACYESGRKAGAAMVIRAAEADGATVDRRHAETISSVATALVDGLMIQWLLDPERVPASSDVIAAFAAAASALTTDAHAERASMTGGTR